jgi:hypothetical protein
MVSGKQKYIQAFASIHSIRDIEKNSRPSKSKRWLDLYFPLALITPPCIAIIFWMAFGGQRCTQICVAYKKDLLKCCLKIKNDYKDRKMLQKRFKLKL